VAKFDGIAWHPAVNVANAAHGHGAQPLVHPNGTVIVPYAGRESGGTLTQPNVQSAIHAFQSTNGGESWDQIPDVSHLSVTAHKVAGPMRTLPDPSAAIDQQGTIYVVWQDCRFRAGCSANDIVMSTFIEGSGWSNVTRIEIDPTDSGVDHFIPGLGLDPSTSSPSARLALIYHYYPNGACGGILQSACELDIGFIASKDSGVNWMNGARLAGPMTLDSLANTTPGYMVGDYITTTFAQGQPQTVFAVANPRTNGVFDEAMYSPEGLGSLMP
jgi:hypothetical protein